MSKTHGTAPPTGTTRIKARRSGRGAQPAKGAVPGPVPPKEAKPRRTRLPLGRLLPGGRLAPLTPWILGVMSFIAIVACGAGTSLGRMAETLGRELARGVTVQLLEADSGLASTLAARVSERLRASPLVAKAQPVAPEALRAELAPWLGAASTDPNLPIPALIDVTLTEEATANAEGQTTEALKAWITPVLPEGMRDRVHVDAQAQWLAPFTRVVDLLGWLSVFLLLLALATTVATIVLATRTALDTHRATIEVMHWMGATDSQIMELFQQRAFFDALIGAAGGALLGGPVLWVLGAELTALDPAIGVGAGLGIWRWVIPLAMPPIIAALALFATRWTVRRQLVRNGL